MADIQNSLRRLQESIRGLSDASALVGAVEIDIHSSYQEEEVEEEERVSHNGSQQGNALFDDDRVTSSSSPHRSGSLSNKSRSQPRPASSTSTFKNLSSHGDHVHRQQHRGVDLGGSGRSSSVGSSGSAMSKRLLRDDGGQHNQSPFLSPIPKAKELRDSAEMRAARELEDLRLEKESLQVMKQQLAAVHQLRVDLQRKDSVIQSLQLKVQEGQSSKVREGRLEAHCHLLEKRCSYLESANGDYAERFGALDQESRSKIDGLTRETDDLRRELHDKDLELKAQARRFEAAVSTHRRELAEAAAEGADARSMADDMKNSLEEVTAQSKRRQGRWAEMEQLLTSQLEDTRRNLVSAERKVQAAEEARRRDVEAAAAAAAALSRHLMEAPSSFDSGSGGGGDGDGGWGRGSQQEQREGTRKDPTAAFVELSGRWCGNEILALTWVEISKVLEALEAARGGQRTAVLSLRGSKQQVAKQREEIGGAKQELEDLREELSRLRSVEVRLESTTRQLESARESSCGQERVMTDAWSRLSKVGIISSPSRGVGGGHDKAGTSSHHGEGEAFEENQGGAPSTSIEEKEERITAGIKRLLEEWSERGNALEQLRTRLREEGVRRDEERARLETLLEAANKEAGARGDELARHVVEFETRAACAEADMERKVAKIEADAVAAADLRISTVKKETDRKLAKVTAEASRKVSEALESAGRKVSDTFGNADRQVALATERAAEKEKEANRIVAEAQEALADAKAGQKTAVQVSRAAVERQRGAEAAVRILGRFVGPLHRLCLELREQKRFLSRSYRRDSPLQAELFAIAAAVSGRDYWCLFSSGTVFAADDNVGMARRRRGRSCSGGNRNGSGGGKQQAGGDGQFDDDFFMATSSTASAGGHCAADGVPSPVHLPPSLRAVVIAVVASNRLAAFAREASAARNFFLSYGSEGTRAGGSAAPGEAGAAEAAASGAEGGGVAGRMWRDGESSRYHHRGHHNLRAGGGERGTDARYMARAGGVQSLPVLPPWCCGVPGRSLEMPAAEELEALPDGKALETVLEHLLGSVDEYGAALEGRNEGGSGGEARGATGRRPEGIGSPMMRGGGGGSLNIEDLWGGGGARVGDLLYHLLRGRKDHMTRIKERGLALDPRPPSSARPWEGVPGDTILPSKRTSRTRLSTIGGGGGWTRDGGSIQNRQCRVKLGRAVRLELERSVWLGEGPGQPGSLHLRDIRKALAALARELNDSEGKRLEVEGALRSAGGGVGVAELEESADVLRRRVEVLEEEVSSKPVVDPRALEALEEEVKASVAMEGGLRAQVSRLEEALSTARKEATDATVASERARVQLEDADRRAEQLDSSKQELLREVEQLKAFAVRANLEREECLEKERALANERVHAALDTANAAARTHSWARDTPPPTPPPPGTPRTGGVDTQGFFKGTNNERYPANHGGGGVSSSRLDRLHGESAEDNPDWNTREHRHYPQGQEHLQQKLFHTQEALTRCRENEERSRARCSQLEKRLFEARDTLEEQKSITASMRRAAARAHGDAEAARKKVRDTESQMSRQASKCRRQVSLLEARLLETGVKKSRRRDLLQLQASAQADLVKALRDPPIPSTSSPVYDDPLDDLPSPERFDESATSFEDF